MSQHLPVLNGREVAKAFLKAGFVHVPGRGKGSHMVLHHPDRRILLTIPAHDPVKRGTLRSIIRQAGMSTDEFRELL